MTATGVLGGMGFGAGLAWLFDADAGRRRRALVRDRTLHSLKRARVGVAAGLDDLRHVAGGKLHEMRSRDSGRPADALVAERVRSALGRYVAHSHAISVEVRDGIAELSGPVLASEMKKLVCAVKGVRGVSAIENRLEAHPSAERVPALQGIAREAGTNWRPATRLLAGVAGGAALLGGLRGGMSRAGLVAGPILLARAITNQPLGTLAGAGDRPLVEVQRSLDVEAPLYRVRAFWENLDNLPLFMEGVEAVQDLGPQRAELTLRGFPGRALVERFASANELGWHSVEGSRHALHVRFEPIGEYTRLHLRFSYLPPGGLVGHAFGWLARIDPRRTLDRDLVRLKSLLEVGHTTIRGETVVAGL